MPDARIPGLVSVIVPVYNRAHLVAKTLDSILAQTYPLVEVVTINDGSTDNTLMVLQTYAADYPDRVLVIDQPNTGQVRARNHGLLKARGEYIAFLDSDDTWEPEKLALQLPLFKGNVGLVYSGIYEVDDTGKITKIVPCEPEVKGFVYSQLLIKNRMTGGSVVVTRNALDRVGFFDESFTAGENWELWIRIAKEFRVEYVNQPLMRYLRHQGNMSHDNSRISASALAILQKHLPSGTGQEELKKVYKTAYANYFYTLGVREFSQKCYKKAVKNFLMTWKFRLFYEDSLLRILRSILGTKINEMFSNFRNY